MCLDDIGRVFNQAIYKNLFNNIRYDKTVIGSIDDIKSITKEDLYRCYNTFYHPSNMALFIFTNKDELEVLNVVKENQSKKEFKQILLFKDIKYDARYRLLSGRINTP